MNKILKSNWFILAISILSAIIIWIYIVYEVSPMYEMTVKKIPITYINQTSDFGDGKLTILSANTDTVDVKIKGKRIELSKISKDSINCTVNMESVKSAGSYRLPIAISFNIDGVELLSKNPYNYSFEVDDVISKEKDISINTVGKPANGYIAESVEYSPLKVRLTGAKTIVNKIKTASITVDLSNANDNISGQYKIKFYDKNGDEFTNNDFNTNVTYTELRYNIYQKKSVNIKPVFSNEINRYGKKLVVSKIKPSKITVVGDKRVTVKLDEIETEEINALNIQPGSTIKVNLADLPELAYSEEEISEVEITFENEE